MRALVETTVYTDALLKSGSIANAARTAIGSYDRTLLPVYAIKEFKAGPLKAFVWLHNKLVQLGSFEKALGALHRMSRTPKRYVTSTALEALQSSAYKRGNKRLDQLRETYGAYAKFDAVQKDEYRLALKTAVKKAWKRRRSITTDVIEPLSCYKEVAPREERGLLVLDPVRCEPERECCLGRRLASQPEALSRLREVTELVDNPERARRAKALREIIRKPRQPVTESMCRALGDVIFALFSPDDATILTTNLKDLQPLASALGKQAQRP